MSRYTLEPLLTKHEVAIGWDRPLANFFLQVRDLTIPEDDDTQDPVIVWLGADAYASETNVESVLGEARKWAHVTEDLRARLLSDQHANPADSPSPIRTAMRHRRS